MQLGKNTILPRKWLGYLETLYKDCERSVFGVLSLLQRRAVRKLEKQEKKDGIEKGNMSFDLNLVAGDDAQKGNKRLRLKEKPSSEEQKHEARWNDVTEENIESLSKALEEVQVCRDVLLSELKVPFDVGQKFYDTAAERAKNVTEKEAAMNMLEKKLHLGGALSIGRAEAEKRAEEIYEGFERLARWHLQNKMGDRRYRDVAFSPDGSHIAIVDSTELIIWNLEENRDVQRMAGSYVVAYSPNASCIITRNPINKNDILVQSFSPKKQYNIGTGHGEVKSVAFSPSKKSSRIVSGGIDGIVRIWEWNEGEFNCINIFTYGGEYVNSVAFNFDGSRVAATGGNLVMIWNLYKEEKPEILKTDNKLNSVAFSPAAANGSILVALNEREDEIYVWEVKNKTHMTTLRSQVRRPDLIKYLSMAAFSLDGEKLAVGDILGLVTIYSTSTWEHQYNIQVGDHRNRIIMEKIAFSPNGFQMCALGDNVDEEDFNYEIEELPLNPWDPWEDDIVRPYVPETLFIFKYGLT
jgi:hypothetical protein